MACNTGLRLGPSRHEIASSPGIWQPAVLALTHDLDRIDSLAAGRCNSVVTVRVDEGCPVQTGGATSAMLKRSIEQPTTIGSSA